MSAVLGHRQAYLSQQLSVLRDAGLIQDRRDGLNIFYRVLDPGIYTVIDASRKTLFQEDDESINNRLSVPECPCPKCNNLNKSD